MSGRIPSTRLSLIRLRQRTQRTQQGLGLLNDKRDALMRAFLTHVSERLQFHDLMERKCREAVTPLVRALGAHSARGLAGFGTASRRNFSLEAENRKIWGLSITTFRTGTVMRKWTERGFDHERAGWVVNRTADKFEQVLDLILETADTEVRIKRLGQEIKKTSRRINALEYRLLPAMKENGERIRRSLEEGERDEQQRLRCLKRLKGRKSGGRAG